MSDIRKYIKLVESVQSEASPGLVVGDFVPEIQIMFEGPAPENAEEFLEELLGPRGFEVVAGDGSEITLHGRQSKNLGIARRLVEIKDLLDETFQHNDVPAEVNVRILSEKYGEDGTGFLAFTDDMPDIASGALTLNQLSQRAKAGF